MERANEILNDHKKKTYMNGFDFSLFIQDCLISEHGYVIDTGNYENVNLVCAERLMEKIRKHPFIWKWFFMIA